MRDKFGPLVQADTLGFEHYPGDMTSILHTLQAAASAEIVGKLSCSGHWWVAVRPHKAQPYTFPLELPPSGIAAISESDPASTARTPAEHVHATGFTQSHPHNSAATMQDQGLPRPSEATLPLNQGVLKGLVNRLEPGDRTAMYDGGLLQPPPAPRKQPPTDPAPPPPAAHPMKPLNSNRAQQGGYYPPTAPPHHHGYAPPAPHPYQGSAPPTAPPPQQGSAPPAAAPPQRGYAQPAPPHQQGYAPPASHPGHAPPSVHQGYAQPQQGYDPQPPHPYHANDAHGYYGEDGGYGNGDGNDYGEEYYDEEGGYGEDHGYEAEDYYENPPQKHAADSEAAVRRTNDMIRDQAVNMVGLSKRLHEVSSFLDVTFPNWKSRVSNPQTFEPDILAQRGTKDLLNMAAAANRMAFNLGMSPPNPAPPTPPVVVAAPVSDASNPAQQAYTAPASKSSDAKVSMPKLSKGGDVRDFLAKLQIYFELAGVPENQKISRAVLSIESSELVDMWLGHVRGNPDTQHTFQQFSEKLLIFAGGHGAQTKALDDFYSCKQAKQSVDSYIRKFNHLVTVAGLPYDSPIVINGFLRGLADDQFRTLVCVHPSGAPWHNLSDLQAHASLRAVSARPTSHSLKPAQQNAPGIHNSNTSNTSRKRRAESSAGGFRGHGGAGGHRGRGRGRGRGGAGRGGGSHYNQYGTNDNHSGQQGGGGRGAGGGGGRGRGGHNDGGRGAGDHRQANKRPRGGYNGSGQ